MMNIHKLLKRQLEKTTLSVDEKPADAEHWQKFLNHVNQSYLEADQERYLQERSMQISSKEVMALNERLERAQQIAKLGYWSYDAASDRTTWSTELYKFFHFQKTVSPKGFNEFLDLIHEEDRYELKEKFNNALLEKENFEQIIRVKIPDNKHCWFQMIGQCNKEDNSLSGIIMNVHAMKEAEEEINQLNKRLILTARQAGMAEVAASILHNIGNILNTLNVSLDLLKKNQLYSIMHKFMKINEMLMEHQDDLQAFLTDDPKGQLIPEYTKAMREVVQDEEIKFNDEIASLHNNIQHIREIVTSQKLIGGVPNLLQEKIHLPGFIDMMLKMVMISSEDEKIIIEKNFEDCPPIETDKSKLLQILGNLLQNAKDAVSTNTAQKKLVLGLKLKDKDFIAITVTDNGVGIDPENIERIFAFGFTTKKEGHGFGLHSSALSAKQMGGTLSAESEGPDKGTTFTLLLPVKCS